VVAACLQGGVAGAQVVDAAAKRVAAASQGETGTPWAALTAQQQQALAPLKAEWRSIDAGRKEKWIDVASRMTDMAPLERARIQQRMTEWARMSPAERGQARIQFQEARKVAPGNREQRWQAYQALPLQERRELAEKATQATQATQASRKPAAPAGSRPAQPHASQRLGLSPKPPAAELKRNLVPFLPTAPGVATPRQVAPAVVQARPGATTSLVTTPAKPPVHQQAGLPKVNAGAEFVNPATLLPRRGPQGAAVIASEPAKPAPQKPQ
jgi:hypothetical protein